MALSKSLEKFSYLATSHPQYKLDATLVYIDNPIIGMDLTIKSVIQYSIFKINDNKQVYSKKIESFHTEKFSDTYFAPIRSALAKEGSVRKNIELLICELNKDKKNK